MDSICGCHGDNGASFPSHLACPLSLLVLREPISTLVHANRGHMSTADFFSSQEIFILYSVHDPHVKSCNGSTVQ